MTTRRAEFQSARQIIGFPKHKQYRARLHASSVSICKADYWLPQVRAVGFVHKREIVSICKADYWLPQGYAL